MGWEDPNHDIMGDIAEYVKMAKQQTFNGPGFSMFKSDPYESTAEAKMPGAQFYLLTRGPYAGGKTLYLASGGTADINITNTAYLEPPISKHTPSIWSTGYSEVQYRFILDNVKPWTNQHFIIQAFDDPVNFSLAERMATQILTAMGQGYDTPDAKNVLVEAIGKVMALKA